MTTTTIRRTQCRRRRSPRRWRDDPAIKLAHRFSEALACTISHDERHAESSTIRLFGVTAELERCRRRIELSTSHGLAEARRRERERLVRLVREVAQAACDFSSMYRPPSNRSAPSVGFILAEIRHLQDEFPSCDVAANAISVTTSPITLEGVHLGEFRIELSVARVRAGHLDGLAIRAIALDPHPAVGREDVTHPHVADEGVCLGDATAPLARALADGRLAEVFLLVNAVLQTYNSGSPYVSIAEWEGISCGECGTACCGDETYFCTGCETEFCSDCVRSCSSCDRSHCDECLQDDADGDALCTRCRGRCASCGSTTRQSELDERGSLCAACDDREQAECEEASVDDADADTDDYDDDDHDVDEDGAAAATDADNDSDNNNQSNQQEMADEPKIEITTATDDSGSIEPASGASPVTIANAFDAMATE